MLTVAAIAIGAPSASGSEVAPQFSDPGTDGISLPTWRSRYVWSDDDGYAGWNSQVFAADNGAYEFSLGLADAPGLWEWPAGDREYRPGGGAWILRAPGTTRIARATVDLAYRTKTLAHLCIDAGLRSDSAERDSRRDCKPPEKPAVESAYIRAFRDPDSAPAATEAYLGLVMPPCNNPADTPCSKYIPAKDPSGNGPMLRAKAVSLVLVDDDLPVVNGSGAFFDLAGTYINGRDVYPLTISASDAGAGVARVGLEHVSHSTLADRGAPCDPSHHTIELGARICPERHSETLDVDTRPMPEGTQRFRNTATDPAGNEGDQSFSVIIDRTPPPPPTGEFFSVEEGSAQARWDVSADPILVDGTPGSGTAGYRYRFEIEDSGWTDWVDAGADAGVTQELSDLGAGTLVDFQVVAVDAVDNVSEPATFSGVVPGDAPELSVSGPLRDLDGQYVRDGFADVTLQATDDGVGVRWVGLERDGAGPISVSDAPCEPQPSGKLHCPAEHTGMASVDLGALPEGAQTFVASAGDRAGNVSPAETWTVVVDRSAPSMPDGIRLENYIAEVSEVDLTWDDGDDPDLPGEISGSGAARSEWRVLRDGAWSDWNTTDEESAVLTGVTPGEAITAEVRTLDAVGNASEVAQADVTVPGGAARAAVASAAGLDLGFANCTPLIKSARARDKAPHYRDFEEVKTDLRGTLRILCTMLENVDKVHVTARFAVEDSSEDDGYRGIQLFVDKMFPDPHEFRPMDMGGVVADCDPDMGGRKRYVIVGEVKYYRDFALDKTRPYNTDRNRPKRLRCPDFAERRQREVNGWLYLSRRAFKRSDDTNTAPHVQLAKDLDKPSVPVGVPYAWAAHHIVPATDRRARDLQAYLFRCGVHPNEERNGIYLRGSGLKKTRGGRPNPVWVALSKSHPDLAYRTYHGDTFGSADRDRDYFTIIRSLMGGFDKERCPIGDGPDFDLKDIKQRLANGNLGVQREGN